ncbi:hypothetical protein Tco_0292309 [Tanacetum coccineum]
MPLTSHVDMGLSRDVTKVSAFSSKNLHKLWQHVKVFTVELSLPQKHIDQIRKRSTSSRSFMLWSTVFMLTMLLFYGGTFFIAFSRRKNGKETKYDKKDDVNDDDVNDDHTDHSLDKTQETGSLESRKEKMQTPISSPYRSPMTNLSLDKIISMELTDTVSPTPDTTSQGHSKHTSINTKDLPGIESYQIKINLTAPTLIYPGIEARDPYTIVDKPTTGLIYLNIKEEKRVMYLVEIVKFCDAMQESVLKEVKLKIFEIEFWKKPPLLGELDLDIMKTFKIEVTKRLRHRE